MEWEFRITDEDGGDPTPLIIKDLEEHDLLKQFCVFVDNNHAEFIEFGSAPAASTSKKYYDEMSPVRKKIYDWVEFKFSLTDKAEIKKIGDKVYRKIMDYGIDPYPYMRPAMYSVLSDLESQNDAPWLDKPHPNGCLFDICDLIAELMADILAMNDNIYSSELITSISVVEPSEAEVSEESANPVSTSNVGDDIWSSTTVGYDGHKQPNYRVYRGV